MLIAYLSLHHHHQ